MCRNQNKNFASPIAFIKYIWLKKIKSNVLDSRGCYFIGQAQIEPRCQSQTAKYDKSRSFKMHKISEKNKFETNLHMECRKEGVHQFLLS